MQLVHLWEHQGSKVGLQCGNAVLRSSTWLLFGKVLALILVALVVVLGPFQQAKHPQRSEG